MANAFVKAASAGNANAATFGSAVTAGNLLVGAVTYAAAETVSSVTDSLSNTYSLLTEVEDFTSAQTVRGFYAMNIAGGTPTVTANGVTNGSGTSILVHEVSGAATSAALDAQGGQVDTSPGTGTDALNSGAITTGTNGCYVFCVAALTSDFSDGGVIYTPGATPVYTERVELFAINAIAFASEDNIQAAAGSIDGTWTTSRGTATYVVIIAAFKEAVAAFDAALTAAIQYPTQGPTITRYRMVPYGETGHHDA